MLLKESTPTCLFDIKIRQNKKLNSVDSIIWPWVFPRSLKQYLESIGRIIQLEAGEDLILSTKQNQLVIIIYGSLKVSSYSIRHKPYILDFYFAGDSFEYSDASIFDAKINYRSLEHCFIYTIPMNVADKKNKETNEFYRFLCNSTHKKVRQTQRHLAVLATFNATQKVAFFLVLMFERLAIEKQVQFPMRRLDISHYLSLTPETISRELNSFQRLGLININGESITFNNMNTLRELYL